MRTPSEVAKHNSKESCWVIISGQVYDVTEYLDDHPGGAKAILRFAGKDATDEYGPIHPAGTIEKNLPPEKHLGPIFDNSYIQESKEKTATTSTPLEILPLSVCKTLTDLRDVALKVMPQRGRVYFLSGAETMNAFDGNLTDWNRIKFRPRVLRDVAKVSMRCSIMGAKSTLPVFIAPAAHARLGHDDGELCLVRGASRMGIPQCICTYASVSHTELVDTFHADPNRRGGAIFFQLYVPKEKTAAKELITKAKSLGFQALVVTVDSPVVGKRDDDDRFTSTLAYEAGIREDTSVPFLPGEEPGPLRAFHSPTLDWNDLTWIRECWGSKPIILKGIQTVEDAVEATQHDINGIYLSNHGGRQLDYAPSSVEVLLDIRKYHPDIFHKVDVYVDGGIMRGSDVVKALCLGARAVGIGRGFMFALSAYGTEGVLKAISILSDEIQTTMRLLGVTDLSQLNKSFVNTTSLENPLVSAKL